MRRVLRATMGTAARRPRLVGGLLDSSEVAGPPLSTTLVPNTGDAIVFEIAAGIERLFAA